MRLCPLLLTPLAALLATPQEPPKPVDLHFYILNQGKKIGSAVFSRSVKDDEIRKILTLNIKVEDKIATIVIDTTSKKDGTPLKKSFIQNGAAGASVSAVFGADGADVIKAPSPTKQNFPAPGGAQIADPTTRWFIETKPATGTKATYYNFNVQSLLWEETTVVYIEDVDKKIEGKTYPSHHLRISAATGSIDEFVDDQGDPILIDPGSYQIQRSES